MGELSRLPNIGKVLEEQLNQARIMTADDLRSIGAKQAWLRIKETDESACMHKLLALEGAVQNIKKTELPDVIRADLKEFFNNHKFI